MEHAGQEAGVSLLLNLFVESFCGGSHTLPVYLQKLIGLPPFGALALRNYSFLKQKSSCLHTRLYILQGNCPGVSPLFVRMNI